MTSKPKQRCLRHLKSDMAWWKSEAEYCGMQAFEQANKIAELRSMVIHVSMPVVVPVDMLRQPNGKSSKGSPSYRNCNDGTRHGCSSCAYRMKQSDTAGLSGELSMSEQVQRFLIPDDLYQLISYRRPSLQCKALGDNGVFFIPRKDGRPGAIWDHISNPVGLELIVSNTEGEEPDSKGM